MRKIETLLNAYGESHQNSTNKLIHWFCVPLILFCLIGFVKMIPSPFFSDSFLMSTEYIVFFLSVIYYLNLSGSLTIGFIIVFFSMSYLNTKLEQVCDSLGWSYIMVIIIIFVIAWIGQFIGHKIEGKKPSFMQDIQFLLIGPAWLLHFIYRKLNIAY
ncbi:MAG: Mpo1-like protein [Saprospiraceae bacterium]